MRKVPAAVLFLGCCFISLKTITAATDNKTTAERSTAPRSVASFEEALTTELTPALAEAQFGKPNRITGSGLIIYVYNVEGDAELWMGFPGNAPIIYAKVRQKRDGKLLKKLLLRPHR